MTKGSKPLDRASILGAQDLARERVEVPEWGGHVYVRVMTGRERDAFEQSMFKGRGPDRRENLDNLRARLVALTVVDAEGERLFGDEDVEALGGKSARALDRIFAVAQRLNGIGDAEVEELVGNSAAARSGAFISGSPASSA